MYRRNNLQRMMKINKMMLGCICIVMMLCGCTQKEKESEPISEPVPEVVAETEPKTVAVAEVDNTENKQENKRENKQEDKLAGWVGAYTYERAIPKGDDTDTAMVWKYTLVIYKENGEYYADVAGFGYMMSANIKAHVYGDEEWIVLIEKEDYEDNLAGYGECDNGIVLSLKKDGENIYTYWGDWYPEGDYKDGEVFFEVNTDLYPRFDAKEWIGTYEFQEVSILEDRMLKVRKYQMEIYQKNDEYYADISIYDNQVETKITARVVQYRTYRVALIVTKASREDETLEELENCLYMKLKRDGNDIYTYWGACQPLVEENKKDGEVYFVKTNTNPYF